MADQPFTGSLKPGVRLDKYEVREQLAAGGMAIIYKAYDPTLDRYVAIKQIAPHLAQDEKFAVRFRTEAQTLARLSGSQANIVHVHELIQQDGQLYLVMEYVEGTTLRAMMGRGPIPLQAGMGILLSTALGLRAMHAQGIVHRDLTPANIMMAKDGALKITDFGLIGHSGGRTSLPMGTTKYMAPEMFTGAPVDPRADLYSLGMIAYEMFAGPEKFAEAFKDVLRDEKAQQVRWMHWHSNLSTRAPALKELQPGIPPLVSKIVERMMDKDPSKRFGSADQIIRWLRKIFVMTVQARSVSVVDSEAMEKEIETETAVTVPAVRPAAAAPASQAAAPATTAEKTAPLPKPEWTWRRAAFWATVVGGPLLIAAVALTIWKYNEHEKHVAAAQTALAVADDLFKNGKFADADRAYVDIAMKYPDLPDIVTDAQAGSFKAQAEASLANKEWGKADAAANEAQKKKNVPQWYAEFRKNFLKSREVEEKLSRADTLQKTGDFEGAIAVLTDLVGRYPDLKLNDRIGEVKEQMELREYRSLVNQGKEALGKSPPNLDVAFDFFTKAKDKRDTPEVEDLLQAVIGARQLAAAYAAAQDGASKGQWDVAAAYYAECLRLRPSETFRKLMNDAKAEALAAKAGKLVDSGLMKEATEIYQQVVQFNPQHPRAIEFLKRQGQAEQLRGFIEAGDKAMAEQRWDAAINSYTQALPLLDPKDAATPKRLGDQITEARYQLAMTRAREAFAAGDYPKTTQYAQEAARHKDTQEVKDFMAQLDRRQQYQQHLDVGKELLSQASYVKALAEFQTVQKIDDTPEVRSLITETNYLRYMAQGKVLLSQKKYGEAAAMFGLARRAKDTPEAKGYEKQAQDLDKAEKKDAR